MPEYQALIRKLVVERGFDHETPEQVFMLLIEELGELAKARRKASGMKTGDHSKQHNLEEEAADIFWLLVDLCNRLNIDLEKAFAAKEAVNQQRTWQCRQTINKKYGMVLAIC